MTPYVVYLVIITEKHQIDLVKAESKQGGKAGAFSKGEGE